MTASGPRETSLFHRSVGQSPPAQRCHFHRIRNDSSEEERRIEVMTTPMLPPARIMVLLHLQIRLSLEMSSRHDSHEN